MHWYGNVPITDILAPILADNRYLSLKHDIWVSCVCLRCTSFLSGSMGKLRQIKTFFICPKFRGILLRIMSNKEFKWENRNFKRTKQLLADYFSLQVWKFFVRAKNTYFTWPRKNAQISATKYRYCDFRADMPISISVHL